MAFTSHPRCPPLRLAGSNDAVHAAALPVVRARGGPHDPAHRAALRPEDGDGAAPHSSKLTHPHPSALRPRSRQEPWSVLIPLPSLARQAADLESLAKQLNPTVGFYDPLGFAKSGMGEAGTLASEEAVIGFLRQVIEGLRVRVGVIGL